MWHETSCRDRILHWRNWRKGLDALSFDDALATVCHEWMMVPTVNHYLTPDDPTQWPTPWELVADNHYCDLAVCLGIFYSLSLSKHRDEHSFSIVIYDDPINHRWYNLCMIDDGKTAANLEAGIPVNIALPETAILKFQYTKFDLVDKLG